mgnify:CR=1 FL=1
MRARAGRGGRAGFTLIEILVVVVILGILAIVVVPQFANATEDAAQTTTLSELDKLRRAIEVYRARNGTMPLIPAGSGTWGPLVGTGEYLRSGPVNPWVGGVNRNVIIHRSSPDTAFQTTHAWIYNPETGQIWAGGFDGQDNPFPRQ